MPLNLDRLSEKTFLKHQYYWNNLNCSWIYFLSESDSYLLLQTGLLIFSSKDLLVSATDVAFWLWKDQIYDLQVKTKHYSHYLFQRYLAKLWVLLINVVQAISFRLFLVKATEGQSIIEVRNWILSDFYMEWVIVY